MKKILVIIAILAILVAGVTIVTAGNGPAEGAGDCIPNEGPLGPNGSEKGPGPFDFSGDGYPQGYPWD